MRLSVDVGVSLAPAGEAFDEHEGLKDAAGVRLSAPEIVDLAAARVLCELVDEARNIAAVNIVSDLFALVAVDLILAIFEVALHKIAEETVQFHAGVIRTGKTAAAQGSRWACRSTGHTPAPSRRPRPCVAPKRLCRLWSSGKVSGMPSAYSGSA